MPSDLKDSFVAVAKFQAGPFKVTLKKTPFTVSPGVVIHGRVLDHKGRPVPGATVFFVEHRMLRLQDGKARYFKGPKSETDKDGRFVLHGARSKMNRIVVSAPSLPVWNVPGPGGPQEVTIRLPEPATLVIRYDIEGDEPKARFHLHLMTWEMPDWRSVVDTMQNPEAPNKGRVVVKGLTPGTYDLARTKSVRAGNFGRGFFCNRRRITLQPGKTAVAEFVRPEGHPIVGEVAGLAKGSVPGVFIEVASAGNEKGSTTLDALACEVNGRFKTARIPPGTYTVTATAYKPDRGVRLGLLVPQFVGHVEVTVPKDRPPAPVRIQMAPRGK